MNIRRIFFLSALSLLALAGCTHETESELNILERRIEKLERRCDELNTTLSGLRTVLDNLKEYDFLTSVSPLTENGQTIGYLLKFTHSDPVTLYNGTDAETPTLGVAQGEDGVWYWTVRYPSDTEARFVTDNFGVRIATSAPSPQLKIEDGYWFVSFDEGALWRNLGKATGEDGASFFESVTDMGDYIQFNLLNGSVIQVPTWGAFEKLQENCRKANENLESFKSLARAFVQKVYVSNLVPLMSGTDTIGMKLNLSDGSSYSFYNGTGTNVPVVGARKLNDSDDVWYWTIQYGDEPFQWILDEKGQKIQANANESLTPHLSIEQAKGDPAWYWAVAYGDGEPQFLLHDGQKVQVSLDVPDPVVTSIVSVRDDLVYVTLDGGLGFYIPMAQAILVTFAAPVQNHTLTMASGATVSFSCHLDNATGLDEVLPVAHDYFYATASTIDRTTWQINVTAPVPFVRPSSSRLDILVSNGRGAMKNIAITILPAN